MYWLTPTLTTIAGACVSLALVNIFVWLKQPERRVHLLFFAAAISVAAIIPFEWLMARAQTTEQFGSALRWIQVPLTCAVISFVWFLWLAFGAGRRWLAIGAVGLRIVAMLLGFWFTPNINYRELTELRQVSLIGETVSAPVGIINPWTLLGQLSTLLVLLYAVDGALSLWRKGGDEERRRAIVLGSATVFFVTVAGGQSALILTGLLVLPPFISLPFLAIILAVAYDLSQEVVRADQLARDATSNEERLNLAQEAGEIGTFDWDIQTGRVVWNESLEVIYGLPPGGFGGKSKNWQERVHREDLDRWETDIAEAISQKRSGWQAEYRITRADTGETRWIYTRAKISFDEGGTPIRMLGVNMDITDRKALDAARQQSELQLSGLVKSAMDAIISVNERQRIVVFNAAAERMFGYSSAEMLGQTLDVLIPENFRHSHREYVVAFGETGITNRSMGRLRPIFGRKADGTHFPIEAAISQIKTNDERTYTVIMRDITERKRTEDALRTSEAQFREMADTAPVLIWISGPDRLCTYFNKGWLQFTGRELAEEIGNGWLEGVHADDTARCLETFDSAFERREPFRTEYRLRAANGEYRWIYDCGTPRFSAEGSFLGFIGSAIDITDRKNAEQSINKANAELNELKNQLMTENFILHQEIKLAYKPTRMVGESKPLNYLLFKIEQVAQTDSTVLILGETGTGKELVARTIHEQSKRKDRSLITVNCAALSPTLIESELFGHEKGAFTGATARKLGRFELANGGSLFLDEIGELPLELQSKLLRAIQEGEFERLGGSQTIKVSVRIIAATNRNMEAAIANGTFREDLWYRLNVFPITVPPLRQRKEDIPLLVEHFVKSFSLSFGKPIREISASALRKLANYSWPGNIRELANVIERAVINSQGPVLIVTDQLSEPAPTYPEDETKTLQELERNHIIRVLEASAWRIEGQKGAAKILGLHPSTLRTRMAKLAIRKETHAAPR